MAVAGAGGGGGERGEGAAGPGVAGLGPAPGTRISHPWRAACRRLSAPTVRAGTGAPQGLCVRGREPFPALAPLALPLLPLLLCSSPVSRSRSLSARTVVPSPGYVSPGPPPCPRGAVLGPGQCPLAARPQGELRLGKKLGEKSELPASPAGARSRVSVLSGYVLKEHWCLFP